MSVAPDNLFVSSTYEKLLQYIARPVVEGSDLRLGEEVIRIESQHEYASHGRHRTSIQTASGFQATFDHVIVTAPVGWLQQHPHVFYPPMPESLSRAVNAFNMSRPENAFLRFPKPWWQDHEDGLGHAGKFATSTSFAAPEYALDTNPGRLNQEMFMFDSLAGPDSYPTIMFYIYGGNSRNLTEQLQGHRVDSKEYHNTLDRFLKPYYSRLPGYQDDDPSCQPSKALCSDWEHDKFSGYGSYSHFNFPTKDMKPILATIRTGMGPDRGIWLVGEHAAPDDALAMSVGAYWSGEQAAQRILDAEHALSPSESW
jgi:hypothetical protein